MARIRTIKPEFWEDEKIGALSHGARLLFLCCLNLSDDEGLLRWNAFYLASNAFTYDEIKIETIEKWMKELVDNELIYVYQAGKVKQKIGYIINFHKHQRIDKPQPGKFPPPNYRDSRVKDMIYKRDKGICKLCGNPISEPPKDAPYLEESSRKRMMSCDHIKPRSKGGSDYFSNLQASHLYCNQCKAAKYGEEQVDNEYDTYSLNNSDNNSEVNSKNHSKNHSTEEKEKEEERKEISLSRGKEKFPPPEVVDKTLSECYDELSGDRIWIEIVTMNTRNSGHKDFTIDMFEMYLKRFFEKLQNEGEVRKSPKDAKSHFARWLNIELNKKANYESKPITHNIYEQKRIDSERRKSRLMAEFAEADAKFLAEQEAKRKAVGSTGEIPNTIPDRG